MQFIESTVIGVRSAVITLGRRTTPLTFVLFPMVHVGEQSFYDEVARRASACDLIVAEGQPDSSPMQSRMAGLRWDHQVDQLNALDLDSLGVPIIWESGHTASAEERARAREARSMRDKLLHTAVDSAAALAMRALGRYGDPRDHPGLDQVDMHDSWEAEGGIDAFLERKILVERDRKLVKTLGKIHRERYHEHIKIAVVWGAAHMTAVVDTLKADFTYYVKHAEWITVSSN